MWINCSPLKEHLAHSLHVIENSTCDCGFSVENNFYFLLEYRLLLKIGSQCLWVLLTITTDFHLMEIITWLLIKKVVFEAVQEFFKESGWFS